MVIPHLAVLVVAKYDSAVVSRSDAVPICPLRRRQCGTISLGPIEASRDALRPESLRHGGSASADEEVCFTQRAGNPRLDN
jgi:hypothetical protein